MALSWPSQDAKYPPQTLNGAVEVMVVAAAGDNPVTPASFGALAVTLPTVTGTPQDFTVSVAGDAEQLVIVGLCDRVCRAIASVTCVPLHRRTPLSVIARVIAVVVQIDWEPRSNASGLYVGFAVTPKLPLYQGMTFGFLVVRRFFLNRGIFRGPLVSCSLCARADVRCCDDAAPPLCAVQPIMLNPSLKVFCNTLARLAMDGGATDQQWRAPTFTRPTLTVQFTVQQLVGPARTASCHSDGCSCLGDVCV